MWKPFSDGPVLRLKLLAVNPPLALIRLYWPTEGLLPTMAERLIVLVPESAAPPAAVTVSLLNVSKLEVEVRALCSAAEKRLPLMVKLVVAALLRRSSVPPPATLKLPVPMLVVPRAMIVAPPETLTLVVPSEPLSRAGGVDEQSPAADVRVAGIKLTHGEVYQPGVDLHRPAKRVVARKRQRSLRRGEDGQTAAAGPVQGVADRSAKAVEVNECRRRPRSW